MVNLLDMRNPFAYNHTMKKTKSNGLRSADWLQRNHRAAWDNVGGLSAPSKMPCYSTSTPARECVTGGKLREVKGSTCFGCYAYKGNYNRPNVKTSLAKRFDALDNANWVDSMSTLIREAGNPFFRWHDSGDIQSIDHLRKIVRVANLTPTVSHWLPTREYAIVKEYLASDGNFPENLTVRLSAHMVDGTAPNIGGLPTSTVSSDKAKATCIAYAQGGKCVDCRACWDKSTLNVCYPKH